MRYIEKIISEEMEKAKTYESRSEVDYGHKQGIIDTCIKLLSLLDNKAQVSPDVKRYDHIFLPTNKNPEMIESLHGKYTLYEYLEDECKAHAETKKLVEAYLQGAGLSVLYDAIRQPGDVPKLDDPFEIKAKVRKACALLLSEKDGAFDDAMDIFSEIIGYESPEAQAFKESNPVSILDVPKKDTSFEFKKKGN